MTTIDITNQKGGVGKTNTAVTMAAGAAMRGLRVLLIDMDSQANAGDALGVRSGPTLYHWLIDGMPLAQVAQEVRPNLYLVRSDKTTANVNSRLMEDDFRAFRLARALKGHGFDLVILDSPPSTNTIHICGLVAADYALIPTELEQFAAKGIEETRQAITTAAEMANARCQVGGIIPTMYDRRNKEQRAQFEHLVRGYGALIWPPVPVDAKVATANRKGKTLWEYVPTCRALVGYQKGKQHVGGYEAVLEKLLDLVGR